MKLSIINKIKYSTILYTLYFYIGNIIMSVLSLIIKPKKNNILFISFGGRKYDDSPKAIFEQLLNDPRFEDWDISWSFQNPSLYKIPRAKIVKTDSLKYYINLMRASVWITNSGVERGLSIPKGRRFYLNTWHGTPIKKMGTDINKGNTSFKSRNQTSAVDVMMAQSYHDVDVFSRSFGIPVEKFELSGLPRNDELIHRNNNENIEKIKKRLGIPKNKKVILYAPTFREYSKDENSNCILKNPINLKLWEQSLSSDFILLFRAHYEVAQVMGVEDNNFIKNVSSYGSLNELMLVSDLLISDYSSIFFDFAILERPMLAYCYDYDIYTSKRGMYFDIREKLNSYFDTEVDLLEFLMKQDFSKQKELAKNFKKEFKLSAGSASNRVLDLILNYREKQV